MTTKTEKGFFIIANTGGYQTENFGKGLCATYGHIGSGEKCQDCGAKRNA